MKAFVIKNKEGKYFDKEIICFCEPDYVCCEHIYYTADDAKRHIDYYGLKDCKVVEITIAEGNLLQKIGELKDYIYSYNNEINNRPQVCNEYIDATCSDILEKMKELKL